MSNNIFSEDMKSYLKYMLLLYLRSAVGSNTTANGCTLTLQSRDIIVTTIGNLFEERTNSEIEKTFREWLSLIFTGKELASCIDYLHELLTNTIDKGGLRPTEDMMKSLSINNNCKDEYYKLLENIEEKEYDDLKQGYLSVIKKFIKSDDIEFLDKMQSIINFTRKFYTIITKVGSRIVYNENGYKFSQNVGLGYDDVVRTLSSASRYGLIQFSEKDRFFNIIVPAPLFEKDLKDILKQEPKIQQTVVNQINQQLALSSLPIIKCDSIDFSKPPTREILEYVVATALKSLGFNVSTDVKLKNKVGSEVEVDVWGTKNLLRVYISCKNWNSDVGRNIIDEEFGRTFNLSEAPHLRILVAKSLNEEARKTALADGFFIIELGNKVNESNAIDMCQLLQDELSKIFISMTPPQLLATKETFDSIVSSLKDLEEKVAELGKSLGVQKE